MSKFFWDFDKKDVGYNKASDDVAIKPNGDVMVRMNKNLAIDLDTGEVHLISDWSKNSNKVNNKKRR